MDICNSPDVKYSALPTLDSRCFQSLAYEQQYSHPPIQKPPNASNITDTACQTIESSQPVHQLGGANKSILEKSSSGKNLSMWLPSKTAISSKRLNMYDDIQRVDSVLMLGSSSYSEYEQANILVIESQQVDQYAGRRIDVGVFAQGRWRSIVRATSVSSSS